MKRISQNRGAKGFTLIELLVVITIIGILASIAIPGYFAAMEAARKSAATQFGKGLGTVFTTYATDHEQNGPGGAGTSTDVFAKLLAARYLQNGEALFINNTPGKTMKYPGGATPLAAGNVCWDVMVSTTDDPQNPGSKLGVNSGADENLPLIFSTVPTGTYTPVPNVATEITLNDQAAFKLTGVVAVYKAGNARFVPSSPDGKTIGFQSANYMDTAPYTKLSP